MSGPNRVRVSPDAETQIEEMSDSSQRQARGLIIELAADPLRRRMGRLDIGMISQQGQRIWAYQEADFWIGFTEETDGGLTIVSIWER